MDRDAAVGCERDGVGLVEELSHVEAEERRGDEPEEGERAVAAADVRRIRPDAEEAFLAGEVLERRAGIGDGDEVRSGVLPLV